MMTKEQIYEEFNIVKLKDEKKKKKSFAHRIAYLQGHADAKKSHPNQYRHLDINFNNLIIMYQSGDPEMYMYKKHGIEPYWMKQQREEDEEKAKRKNGIKENKDDFIIDVADGIK